MNYEKVYKNIIQEKTGIALENQSLEWLIQECIELYTNLDITEKRRRWLQNEADKNSYEADCRQLLLSPFLTAKNLKKINELFVKLINTQPEFTTMLRLLHLFLQRCSDLKLNVPMVENIIQKITNYRKGITNNRDTRELRLTVMKIEILISSIILSRIKESEDLSSKECDTDAEKEELECWLEVSHENIKFWKGMNNAYLIPYLVCIQ